jgi:predicted Zn-dependent protease
MLRAPFFSRLTALALASVLALQAVVPVQAQGAKISFIRDAEIEQVMRDYLDPILGAAGLRKGFIRVVLVNDRSFNAFVADGKRVFVNIGAIMESKTPNQLIGVLAHEAGHIAGGHLARMRVEMNKAMAIAVIGTLLGGAAVVGSARGNSRTGSEGNVGTDSIGAMGALLGGSEMARRSMLAYMRGEEQAADRSALVYLEKTGQSPKGMVETFERMASDSLFTSTRVDKYTVSHPLPNERVAALKEAAQKSPHYGVVDPPARQLKHDMIRAKLLAFSAPKAEVNRRYPAYDNSLPARYAKAIMEYRHGRPDIAQRLIDALIKEQPNNPYFWELKGQAYLEGAQPHAAIAPLRKAVSIAPGQALIRTMLGHALLATETPANIDAALKELSNATSRDPENYEGFRYLAQAYSRKGDDGNAALASAREALIHGETQDARRLARRATTLLKEGSPAYLAAKDIFESKPEKN